MHAERLFSIIKEISRSYEEESIVPLLDKIISAVNSRISQPGERQFDEQISAAIQALFRALDHSTIHNFSVTWRKIIQELNLNDLLPDTVRSNVENAFSTRLVDSDFLKSLEKIKKQIAKKLSGIDQLKDGFQSVGIHDDELEPEEIEFDVMMPRESINDQLGGFGKELALLNKELMVISNITKNPNQHLRINSISTNDFSLAINIDINLGEVLAAILFGLTIMKNHYRSKVDVVRDKLSDLPTDLLNGINAWANQYVKAEISNLIDKLPTQCAESVDREKLNNLRGQVQAALEYLAENQDKGFNMDVRVGEPDDDEADADPDADEVTVARIELARNRLRAIAEKSAEMKVIERQSTPILSLTSRETL